MSTASSPWRAGTVTRSQGLPTGVSGGSHSVVPGSAFAVRVVAVLVVAVRDAEVVREPASVPRCNKGPLLSSPGGARLRLRMDQRVDYVKGYGAAPPQRVAVHG